ncbi:SSI family serine proteinase inhibitor [Lentzea tibetensis]|nr:SSI family serine proteinase inhibitor [Lentzea tibetensis]
MARTRILFACLMLAAPLMGVIPAGAATQSSLVLSLRQQAQTSLSTAQLKCEPPGGTHQSAEEACDRIAEAEGDFNNLPGRSDSVLCTMEFNETTVAARGKWRGKRVSYRETFANPCLAHAATSGVFHFSD